MHPLIVYSNVKSDRKKGGGTEILEKTVIMRRVFGGMLKCDKHHHGKVTRVTKKSIFCSLSWGCEFSHGFVT